MYTKLFEATLDDIETYAKENSKQAMVDAVLTVRRTFFREVVRQKSWANELSDADGKPRRSDQTCAPYTDITTLGE
jgi:hypothetical protein